MVRVTDIGPGATVGGAATFSPAADGLGIGAYWQYMAVLALGVGAATRVRLREVGMQNIYHR